MAYELVLNGDKMIKVNELDGLKVYAFPADHKNPLGKKDYIMNVV